MPAREQYDHFCAVHHFVGIAQPFGMGATENGRKATQAILAIVIPKRPPARSGV